MLEGRENDASFIRPKLWQTLPLSSIVCGIIYPKSADYDVEFHCTNREKLLYLSGQRDAGVLVCDG